MTWRLNAVGLIAIWCVALAAGAVNAQPATDPNETQPVAPAGPNTGGVPTPLGPGLLDIRIDLSTIVSSTAGNWNNISNIAGLTTALIDFNTGAPSSVSIDGTGSPWSDFFGDDGGAFPDQDWLIQPATVDGSGLGTGLTGSYVIGGLPAGTFRIEVVSARTTFDYLNTFTVDGVLANRTFLGTPVQTPWGSTTDGLTPGNWLIWDGVSPAGGSITLTDVADAGTLGICNAIRILQEVVPVELQSFDID